MNLNTEDASSNRTDPERDVVVSSLMCHHRGVGGGVPSQRETSVIVLRVRGSKKTTQFAESLESDSLTRSVTSPSFLSSFLFPPESQTGYNTEHRSVHTDHTHSVNISLSHTHTHRAKSRHYKKNN